MGRDLRTAGALEFVQAASRDRITHYRTQAEQFREMAETEPVGRLRGNLLDLARQYDQLADSLEIKTSR